uniref:hypothetical protein n=1 Tax=Actinokineospora bangkokensis TaxID=1193682 RepID=UPI0038BBE10A
MAAAGVCAVAPAATAGAGPAPAACAQPSDPDFGPNTRVFDPGMPAESIQSQLDADFAAQKDTLVDQMADGRVAHLFKPGQYAVHDNVGFYTSVHGLGQNPGDVVINGDITVDAFNESDGGVALQNFWRSTENLAVNPSAGATRWAVSQAAPFRRMDIRGDLQLYPASYGYSSGGYIADSKVSGKTASVSQQQWYTRDSAYGSWEGGVWNMVFSGTSGAPANTFPNPPETTLATTPVSRDVPYLYVDGGGAWRVFLPDLRTNASGPSWAGGSTPGSSLPISQFYVATPGASAGDVNAALSSGCNVLFTPGIYHLDQTLRVTNPNTVVMGLGYATLVPDGGITAMEVSDVDGVRLKGLLFDAGTTNSASLLTVGEQGSGADHAQNPTTVQDVFFRVGGSIAGHATNSLVVNSDDVVIDHTWAWRADHGNAGTWGWTEATGDTGVVVNGDDVLATGLFVEHYQKYQVIWNGERGRTIFFQNEMPYDVPDQGAWNAPNGVTGYAAYKVADGVSAHEAWGLGSYCFFNVNPSVRAEHAFEVPDNGGVRLHSLLTVSLNYKGTITHVVNGVGGTTPDGTVPVNVVSYP